MPQWDNAEQLRAVAVGLGVNVARGVTKDGRIKYHPIPHIREQVAKLCRAAVVVEGDGTGETFIDNVFEVVLDDELQRRGIDVGECDGGESKRDMLRDVIVEEIQLLDLEDEVAHGLPNEDALVQDPTSAPVCILHMEMRTGKAKHYTQPLSLLSRMHTLHTTSLSLSLSSLVCTS